MESYIMESQIINIGDEIFIDNLLNNDLHNIVSSNDGQEIEITSVHGEIIFNDECDVDEYDITLPNSEEAYTVALDRHEPHHTEDENSNWQVVTLNEAIYCPYRPCTSMFDDIDNLTRHILQQHITRIFKCDHCDLLFHKEIERDDHDSSKHSGDIFDTVDDGVDVIQPSTDPLIKLYECTHCKKMFGQKYQLTRHVKTHTRPYKCTECSKSFVSNRAAKIHLLTHTKEKPHKCMMCNKKYRDPFHLSEHMLTHNIDSPFACPYCDVKYTTRGPLRLHVFYKHFDGFNDCYFYTCPSTKKKLYLTLQDAQKYACGQCGKPFARVSDLSKHDLAKCRLMNTIKCTTCHRMFSKRDELFKHEQVCKIHAPNGDSSTAETLPLNSFTHRCVICNKRFSHHFQLTRHLLFHSRPHLCRVCGKTFITKIAYKSHMVIHTTGKTLTCLVCSRSYLSAKHLKDHKLTHLSTNPFKCRYCDKVYSTRLPLRRHIFYNHFDGTTDTPYFTCPKTNQEFSLTHADSLSHVCTPCSKSFSTKVELKAHCKEAHSSNPRPYKCSQCGSGFPNKTRLRLHIESHSELRNFQCTVCGVKCTTKSSLTSHMVVHSDNRPYQCTQCPKSFARSIQLKRHCLKHTGERKHQCDVCGKMFQTIADVKKHTLVHDQFRPRPFTCENCGKSFVNRASLNAHVKGYKGKQNLQIESKPMTINVKEHSGVANHPENIILQWSTILGES